MSMLLNEVASGSLRSYYKFGHDDDLATWGELLLHRKRLWKLLVWRRILTERLEGLRPASLEPIDQ